MELLLPLPYPTRLYRVQLHYRDLVMATLVSKASFQVDAQGALSAAQDALEINEGDVETPLGVLENDVVPIKQGCDFAVYGPAVSGRAAVERMDVIVKVGSFTRTVRVTGDRAWVPAMSGVAASKAVPFTTMQLDYSRAFGGKAIHPSGLPTTAGDNPLGLGWTLVAKHAVGTRLPNVEEADQCMTKWDQTPMPAGLLPLPRMSSLRGTRGMDVNLEGKTTTFTPLAFVWSHPRMHLQSFPAGAQVSVVGMSPAPWQFSLPRLSLTAEVALGDRQHRLRMVPDTLCLVPSQRRLWIVARRAFVYQFRPERRRLVQIVGADSADSPTSTIAKELASTAPAVPIGPPDAPENMPIPWEMLRELHPLTPIMESLPLLASG